MVRGTGPKQWRPHLGWAKRLLFNSFLFGIMRSGSPALAFYKNPCDCLPEHWEPRKAFVSSFLSMKVREKLFVVPLPMEMEHFELNTNI